MRGDGHGGRSHSRSSGLSILRLGGRRGAIKPQGYLGEKAVVAQQRTSYSVRRRTFLIASRNEAECPRIGLLIPAFQKRRRFISLPRKQLLHLLPLPLLLMRRHLRVLMSDLERRLLRRRVNVNNDRQQNRNIFLLLLKELLHQLNSGGGGGC